MIVPRSTFRGRSPSSKATVRVIDVRWHSGRPEIRQLQREVHGACFDGRLRLRHIPPHLQSSAMSTKMCPKEARQNRRRCRHCTARSPRRPRRTGTPTVAGRREMLRSARSRCRLSPRQGTGGTQKGCGLSRSRQRSADLVYEAYQSDIGRGLSGRRASRSPLVQRFRCWTIAYDRG
jgi:hypothetical protein